MQPCERQFHAHALQQVGSCEAVKRNTEQFSDCLIAVMVLFAAGMGGHFMCLVIA
jgi:hypothetical protein